ncbi:MAG TPA: hypothetical protein VFV63_16995 [Ilumatobacteraceae bacterium]|nr:hypothetical protein [Ilumatobacteraceae bacterium]
MSTTEMAHLIVNSTAGRGRQTRGLERGGAPNTTMTFLFTDIEGSTRQWEESPEMHDRVERHFTALREAVGDVGGEVFATTGDGIAAAFSSAEAAVGAAVSAQRMMPAIGVRVRTGAGRRGSVRCGDPPRDVPARRGVGARRY